MITQADIAQWRTQVPWTSPENVEQDLVLSRLIIEFANHPLLGNDLVFRGGTCFHKLWLDRPWRYSEDLDYVRRSEGGVGDVLDAIRDVARVVGFDDVRTEIGRHPEARLRSAFLSGQRLQIKVEMNTFERSPAQPTVTRPFAVDSPWFTGAADVATFAIEELTATKIRALFHAAKDATCSTSGLPSNTQASRQPRSPSASARTNQTDGPSPAPTTTSPRSYKIRRSPQISNCSSPNGLLATRSTVVRSPPEPCSQRSKHSTTRLRNA